MGSVVVLSAFRPSPLCSNTLWKGCSNSAGYWVKGWSATAQPTTELDELLDISGFRKSQFDLELIHFPKTISLKKYQRFIITTGLSLHYRSFNLFREFILSKDWSFQIYWSIGINKCLTLAKETFQGHRVRLSRVSMLTATLASHYASDVCVVWHRWARVFARVRLSMESWQNCTAKISGFRSSKFLTCTMAQLTSIHHSRTFILGFHR